MDRGIGLTTWFWGGPDGPWLLAGPPRTSLDRLGDVRQPPLEPGALPSFGQAGAYGFAEALSLFLSHPRAPDVWLGE